MGIFNQIAKVAVAQQIIADGVEATNLLTRLTHHWLESKHRIDQMLADPESDDADRISIVSSIDEYIAACEYVLGTVKADREVYAAPLPAGWEPTLAQPSEENTTP